MDTNKIYARAPECLLEDMDGELLLYNPTTATTLHLNDSSAVIWELCDGERSVGDIVGALQEVFPKQAEQITADVDQVITDLLQKSVLQEVASN